MRVLIVDSSIHIIDRLEEMLSESAIITAIYRSVSFSEATLLFKDNKPEVVLLDFYLPGNESVNLLKEIKKTGYKTSIIILSVQPDNFMRDQYKSMGADFFFDKYHDFDKIPGTINCIAGNNNLYQPK